MVGESDVGASFGCWRKSLTNSMVLAGILGLHHRVNWKDCVQSEGDDKDDAQKFKKAFAPYAPSS